MANGPRADKLYQKLERIGRGSFGEVYHGVEIETGKDVAIKILDLDIEDDELDDIRKEIAILSHCDSEYVTRYHGAFLCGSKLWIILDYAGGGSLRSILKSGPVKEAAIGVICRQVLHGLVYLHKNASIIHRDIKAANILLTLDGYVKLCDFGVAGQMSKSILRRNSFVGTPYWISPEIIKRSQYDYKTDIWSLGITVIELATGNPPFSNHDPRQAILLIANSKPARLDGNYSAALKEFVALCLQEDPNDVSLYDTYRKRPTAEELLKSRFIKGSPNSRTPLLELLAVYKLWKDAHGSDETAQDDMENESIAISEDDGWIFDTMKPSSNDVNNRYQRERESVTTELTGVDTIKTQKVDISEKQPANLGIKTDYDDLYSTLKPLNTAGTTPIRSSSKVIDWDSMINSANSLLPQSYQDSPKKQNHDSKTYSHTSNSVSVMKSASTNGASDSIDPPSKTNSTPPEVQHYHYNSFDKRVPENIRISWSSKKVGKNDRSSQGSETSYNSKYGPKPLDSSFFDLRNESILNEHKFRKEEFQRLLNSFLEQVEKL